MKQHILFVFLLMLFACSEKNHKKGHSIFNDVDSLHITSKSSVIKDRTGLNIHIDLRNFNENSRLYFSEVFDSITYFNLENTSESLIGVVNKLYIVGDHVYVLDTYFTF